MNALKSWKMYIFSFAVILGIIFIVQNYGVIEIHFLFWAFKASQIVIILMSIVLGYTLGFMAKKQCVSRDMKNNAESRKETVDRDGKSEN